MIDVLDGLPESEPHEPGASKYLVLSDKYGFSIAMFMEMKWWSDYQSVINDGDVIAYLPLDKLEKEFYEM